MDKVRETISRRLSELSLEMAEVSRRIGKNQTYIQQFLKRGSPRVLPEDVRIKLASILQVSEAALSLGPRPSNGESGLTRQKTGHLANKNSTHSLIPAHTLFGSPDLPVLGAAKGGTGGIFMSNGEAFDYVARPNVLAEVPGAYAVYMVGESMQPRYFPGEILFVHPHKPIRQGDFVVIQLAPEAEGGDMEYLVKGYIRQDAKRLQVQEYTPKARQFDIPSGRVLAIHRIVGSIEP